MAVDVRAILPGSVAQWDVPSQCVYIQMAAPIEIAIGTQIEISGTAHYDGPWIVAGTSLPAYVFFKAPFIAETFGTNAVLVPFPQREWRSDWLLTVNVRT